jgi:hypothetical protein
MDHRNFKYLRNLLAHRAQSPTIAGWSIYFMNPTSSRTWFAAIAVSLAAVLFVSLTGSPVASPSEEITRAVSAGGAASVKQADAAAFLNAFSSVLVSVDQKQAPSYVSAAAKLRPDLADRITAAAANVNTTAIDTGSESDNHVSQHHGQCRICHNGHTLTLPCEAAQHHLEHHPEDTKGPCPP